MLLQPGSPPVPAFRYARPPMADNVKHEITSLLVAWSDGDEDALEDLMPKVYAELEMIAGRYLRQERADHTLATGALVHEAYLRIVDLDRMRFTDRAHFFAVSAKIMRHILVDHARHVARLKRGGDQQKVPLEDALHAAQEQAPDLVALDDALRALAATDAEQAKVVELRYFGGLNRNEIAEVLGISSATVTRRWRTARARLYRYLIQGGGDAI